MNDVNERKIDEAAEAKLNADDERRREELAARRRAAREAWHERHRAARALAIWRAAAEWPHGDAAYKWASDGGDKAGVWTLGVDAIPAGLRYLLASELPDEHNWLNADGVDGFIVAAMAGVDDWRHIYPNAPSTVEAVHIIAVDADGERVNDGGNENDGEGLHKRTLGLAAGKVCAVWAPGAEQTVGAAVCEGLADAMAIASSAFAGAGGGIAFAVLNGMRNDDVAKELAQLHGAAWIYPDHDADGSGMKAAMDLAGKIREADGESHIADYDKEADDPADAAARAAMDE